MSFRLVPKSVTLNDLEWRNGRYFALFQRIPVASGAHCVKVHVRYLISWWILVWIVNYKLSWGRSQRWCRRKHGQTEHYDDSPCAASGKLSAILKSCGLLFSLYIAARISWTRLRSAITILVVSTEVRIKTVNFSFFPNKNNITEFNNEIKWCKLN